MPSLEALLAEANAAQARATQLYQQVAQALDDLYDRLYEGDEEQGSGSPVGHALPKPPEAPAPAPPAIAVARHPQLVPSSGTLDAPKSGTIVPNSGTIPNVVATCWGNREDELAGNWRQMAYQWSPVCRPGSGQTTGGAALPCRVAQGTVCDVGYRRKDGAYVWAKSVPVIDVGPWNTTDPYWRTGSRPAAESGIDTRGRRTNKAGIDLTPATWAVLLGIPPSRIWASSPSAKVDVVVREPAVPQVPPSSLGSSHLSPNLLGADRLSANFTMAEATKTSHGRNPLPDSLVANARLVANQILEPIRKVLGHGFSPNSWFRSEAVNKAVGGVPDSAHRTALAVDLPRTEEFWQAIHKAGIPQIARVHVEPDHYHCELPGAKGKAPGIDYIKGAAPVAWESAPYREKAQAPPKNSQALDIAKTLVTARIPILGPLLDMIGRR